MAKTFSLSANIENGFAEGMQYLVTPNAQNAIHNIVNDFRSGIHSFTIIGSYGTGKSSFLLALESDLQKTGKQKYLLDAKNLSDAKSFEIMNIVGDYAEMSTLLSKALNVEGNKTSILDSLKNYYSQCQKKGKFLLIVVDEFGKVLEHAAKNNPEKELYFLQKLSELVNVPARNMILRPPPSGKRLQASQCSAIYSVFPSLSFAVGSSSLSTKMSSSSAFIK